MQSLYSFFSSENNEVSVAERSMLKSFDGVVELKLAIISLLVEIVRYAGVFYEDGKKKTFTFFLRFVSKYKVS